MYWAGREPPATRVGSAHRLVGRVPARRRRRPPGGHGRLVRAPSTSRTPARSTSTRVVSTGCATSTSSTRWPCSIRPTTPTSTPSPARRPTSRSSPPSSRCAAGAGTAHLGAVTVLHDLVAYQRKRTSTNEVFEVVPLDFPPRELTTRACWYTLPLDTLLAAGLEPSRMHRRGARRRARAHRVAAAVRDLRPVGRRRRLDGVPPPDRRPHDLRVRRLSGWCRHRRARVRRDDSPRARRATSSCAGCPCDDGCPRACSHRSAGTGTSTSTRTRRSWCSRRSARRHHPTSDLTSP